MARSFPVALLLVLGAASCGASPSHDRPDASDLEQCSCGDGEVCVVEFGGDGYYEDMPWSCFPRPAECGALLPGDCVGSLACGGRPWSYLDDWGGGGVTVYCFSAGTRPCPSYDAGSRRAFDFCADEEICLSTPTSGECYAQCVPVPPECVAEPTCACIGEGVCASQIPAVPCVDGIGACSSSPLGCGF